MIRLRLEDSHALLSVENHGIGVSGLRLGQFVVKQIVEARGGCV